MPRKGEGRPSKLTPEVQERICQLVRDRVPPTVAALACGVSGRTLQHWLQLGEERSGRYRDFADAVRRAEAEAEADCIRQITSAGESRWQAAAFLAERRWASRYSSRVRVVHEADELPVLKIVWTSDEAAA